MNGGEWRPIELGDRVWCRDLGHAVDIARCLRCRWLAPRVSILVLLAAVGLAACTAAAATPAPAPHAVRLGLDVGGAPTPLAPGQRIAVAGTLNATIAVVADTGRADPSLELRLSRKDAPVTDAAIRGSAQMSGMAGSVAVTASRLDRGTYRLDLPLGMAGDWQIVLWIVTPAEQGIVTLDLAAP